MAEIKNIPVRKLWPHPDNPRKDVGDVTELAPVTVVVTPETVEESHYETQAACAELLGVTRARVNALVASGQLESKVFGGRRKVSIESMERWKATERKAGRPARADARETTTA